LKLCVFPNDPILSYYEKGEIKNRYFNPRNLFDENYDLKEDKMYYSKSGTELNFTDVTEILMNNN